MHWIFDGRNELGQSRGYSSYSYIGGSGSGNHTNEHDEEEGRRGDI